MSLEQPLHDAIVELRIAEATMRRAGITDGKWTRVADEMLPEIEKADAALREYRRAS